MKLSAELLRSMQPGESVLITESKGRPVRGQGDVTYLFGRIRGMKFRTKRLYLLDPEAETITRVVRVTRDA